MSEKIWYYHKVMPNGDRYDIEMKSDGNGGYLTSCKHFKAETGALKDYDCGRAYDPDSFAEEGFILGVYNGGSADKK